MDYQLLLYKYLNFIGRWSSAYIPGYYDEMKDDKIDKSEYLELVRLYRMDWESYDSSPENREFNNPILNTLNVYFFHSYDREFANYLVCNIDKIDINEQDGNGNTLLTIASIWYDYKGRKPEYIKLLIQNGANLYIENKKGYSALKYLEECTYGREEVMELIEYIKKENKHAKR